MTTRSATARDLDAIQRIAEQSWVEDYPDILTRETAEEVVNDWYAPEQLEETLEQDRTLLLVAERGETIVGFSHSIWNDADAEGYILRLYVHPDHRREGVGTDLLERTCAALFEQEVDRINAMVLAGNDPGNEFYETFGVGFVNQRETTIGDETYEENRYVVARRSTLDLDAREV